MPLPETFLVVGLGEEDFASLTPEMAQKYERLFHQPEDFHPAGTSDDGRSVCPMKQSARNESRNHPASKPTAGL